MTIPALRRIQASAWGVPDHSHQEQNMETVTKVFIATSASKERHPVLISPHFGIIFPLSLQKLWFSSTRSASLRVSGPVKRTLKK